MTLVGSDTRNVYIISANYLLYGKSSSELSVIGGNILDRIGTIVYRPCTIDAQGLPYMDVGDAISLEKKTVDVESFVFSRTLSGIQNLREEYSAKGNEVRENEVSANEEFEQLKAKTMKISKSVDGLSVELADLEKDTTSRFEQTSESITAEVNRAKEQEQSILTQTSNSISAEVRRAEQQEALIMAEVSEQGSEIVLKVDSRGRIVQVALSSDANNGSTFHVDADNINLSASDVINLLANGMINLTGKNITITSDNFSVTPDGTVTANKGTFKGDITGATGTFEGNVRAESVNISAYGGMGKAGSLDVDTGGAFGSNSLVRNADDVCCSISAVFCNEWLIDFKA